MKLRLPWLQFAVAALTVAAAGGWRQTTRLASGYRTMDRLVEAYVKAVADGDTSRMHRLRVTQREHNELLWPSFPASRPEFNMPVSFAWYNIDSRSRRDASRIVGDFGGQNIEVIDVDCRGGITEYDEFNIYSDCWLLTRHDPAGIKLFGSIVEMHNRYKIIGIIEG